MKLYQLLLAMSCILVAFSCQKEIQKPISKSAYKLFNLEQAGWKSQAISHQFAEISYKATLVPLQYYILKSEGNQNLEKVDSIYTSLKDERVLEIEFQHEKEDDLLKNEYTDRNYETSVKYMAFKIQNDFSAVTSSGDTISCAGVTFERNFKVAPFKRILLHFGNISEEKNIQLLYDDQLFGNGLMKFKFTETPILL